MKLPEMTRRNQIILLMVLLIIAVPSIFIYDYTQNNPKFCTTCHLMNEAYDTWTVSAMHDLNCHSCHETDMATSMNHLYEALTKSPEEVNNPVEIENELCETCHATNDPQWLQVVNTAGHKIHFFENDDDVECIDCHGMNLHVFRPPEEACSECHEDDNLHVVEVMRAECVSCHDFLTEDEELNPQKDQCLDCHGEKELITISMPIEAHLDTTCTNCHNPHATEIAEDCATCHEVEEGLHSISSHSDCSTCHVPHEEIDIRDSCESCHIDKKEHYAPASCIGCHT